MSKRNQWKLTDNLRNKYAPIIKEMIEKIETNTEDVLQFDLADEQLNPSTLGYLLEETGYEQINVETNGWEMDFWITYSKKDYKNLVISGCGMTFSLSLCEAEIDDEDL